MYYAEEIINGVLMFRISPDSSWLQLSIERISQRAVAAEKALHKAESIMHQNGLDTYFIDAVFNSRR
jgi:hypothetical protein